MTNESGDQAAGLIARSQSHTEIVSAPFTPALAEELEFECDGSVVASETTIEYWGDDPDSDGMAWRVHLHGDREITVGDVVEVTVCGDDPLDAYIGVEVTVGGQAITVGACVGAHEANHGTVRASGGEVRPYCTAWWADASDYGSVPCRWERAVLSELIGESYRLYLDATREA